MNSIAYDLGYLNAGVEALEPYLLANGLYWTLRSTPPPGTAAFPSLTLGGLLLALERLKAQNLAPAEALELERLQTALAAERRHWRVAWERKCAQDLRSRLTQWRNFLEEVREQPSAQVDRLAYEVRLRLMLDLLLPDVGLEADPAKQAIASLDAVLRGRSRSGPFLWPELQASAFPAERYWYLYRTLKLDEGE